MNPIEFPARRRARPRRLARRVLPGASWRSSAERHRLGRRRHHRVIVGAGFLIAARPRYQPNVIVGLSARGGVAVVGVGVAGRRRRRPAIPSEEHEEEASRPRRARARLPLPSPPRGHRCPPRTDHRLRRGAAVARAARGQRREPRSPDDVSPSGAAPPLARCCLRRCCCAGACASGRAPVTLEPEGPIARSIDTCGTACSSSPSSCSSSSSSARSCLASGSGAARTTRRRPAAAAPRQHPPGDRLDDRPGDHARRRRVLHLDAVRHQPRARRRPHRSRSPASSGGGSTATTPTATASSPTRTSSPPTTWSSRPGRTSTSTSSQRRHPLVLDPGAQREEGRGARPQAPADAQRRRARHLRRPVHRVLRPVPRLHAPARHRHDPADFDAWLADQIHEAELPTDGEAAAGAELFATQCSRLPPGPAASTTPSSPSRATAPRVLLVSGHAPDLTHFASRGVFAGGDLQPVGRPGRRRRSSRRTRSASEFNRAALEAWLRNPPAEKPMDAPRSPSPAARRSAACPTSTCTEEQIDQLVDFLETLD